MLALAARDEGRLRALAADIESRGGKALVVAADLSEAAAPAAFAAAAIDRFGRIDLVVNNAGATKRGDFLTLTEQDWADGFALKFFAAVRLCRAAWPHLVAAGGSIVNIAGVGGRTGSAEFTIGGSVNAAMLNLTKCLADRGVHDGVRVNAVNPGSILTERLTIRIQRLATDKGVSHEEASRQTGRSRCALRASASRAKSPMPSPSSPATGRHTCKARSSTSMAASRGRCSR